MTTTQTARGVDSVKGPYNASPASKPMHVFRVSVNVSGTYATDGGTVDLAAALEASSHRGFSAINVLWVKCFGDYFDGTNTLTSANADITLSSTGAHTNNVVTFELTTGATNGGTGGSELTNGTAVNGDVGFIFACEITEGSVIGNV